MTDQPTSPSVDAETREWRCFFCDEVFTDPKAASHHFGGEICGEPLCKLAQVDGGIAKVIADLAETLHGFQIEDNATCREFYALGADHRASLIREEQKGYDRGLADARKEAALSAPRVEPVELAEWKQAASVEASLRREFLARAEKAEAELVAMLALGNELNELFNAYLEQRHRMGKMEFLEKVWENKALIVAVLRAPPSQPDTGVRDIVRLALEFYADPFAWKKKHDPEDVLRIPDFYSETSFGDTALEALAARPSQPARVFNSRRLQV